MRPNPNQRMPKALPYCNGKPMLLAILSAIMLTVSCRTKKDAIYRWEGADESRSLTLKRDNTFILEIDAGYYYRVDTGTFLRRGDTLVINPDKGSAAIDSLVEMDILFHGRRFLEVMQPVIDFGTDNRITGSSHKGVIFPVCVINDTLTLTVDPDDPSYRKLHIPDSVTVRTLTLRIPEQRTCKPELTFRLALPPRDPPTRSYRVYVRSYDTRTHYLAGYKWLISGDTIMTSFVDEWCTPAEIKLVRAQ